MAQIASPIARGGSRRTASVLVIAGNEEQQLLSVTDSGCGGHRVGFADMGREGLGLAMCESIVTAHEGRIRVTSEPGSGSTFRLTLPREANG
jgi:K+-sensing histidine kinase KdpD